MLKKDPSTMRLNHRKITTAALLCLSTMTFALAGCGVKPKNLEPPQEESGQFPATYPSQETL